MRYDTPIYFQSIKPGAYDPRTGNYGKDTVAEDKKYANVTDTSVDTLNLIYGGLKQGSCVIRLQHPYLASFERIRIREKRYQVDFSRSFRSKQVFVVSEAH